MLLECDQVVYSPGYFWKILEQRCGANVREKVKGLRMTIDAKVCMDLLEHWMVLCCYSRQLCSICPRT